MDEQSGTGSDKREHPFFIVDNVVLDLGLKAVELALYVAILRFVNHKTNIAFPSAETLAKAAGMERATVLRTIPKLEEKALIKVIRSSGRANHYLVLDPRGAQPTSDSKSPGSDSKSPVSEGEPVTLSHGGSDSKSLGSDSKSPPPVTLSHPNKKISNKTNQPDESNETEAVTHDRIEDSDSDATGVLNAAAAADRIDPPRVQETEDVSKDAAQETGQEAGRVFAAYQDNIGTLTPFVAQLLGEAIDEYGATWVEEAIAEAVVHNVRKWKYIEAILKRRRKESGGKAGDGDADRERRYRYIQGEYAHLIDH